MVDGYLDGDAGARDWTSDDLDDEDALTDAAIAGLRRLASLGLLPELAGLPKRKAA